ncbi:MAG: peptidoglycan-binding protein [Myxococcota bacterium]|nr:peptidoglycan-binding protein [Myxococcota bacterium]
MAISTSKEVQHALNMLGASPPLVEDGKFGDKSKAACVLFQRAHALTVDGVPGNQTKAALQVALDMQAAGVPSTPSTPVTFGADFVGPLPMPVAASAPNAPVIAVHMPGAAATPSTPAVPPHTLHITTATGATVPKPLGTPVPKPSVPWTTAEKAGVAAGVAGLVAAGYFGMSKGGRRR